MRVFSGPMPASESAATTFTFAGNARQASVAGPSKISVSLVIASRSIRCCAIHGAPASPRGGLRLSIVTDVIAPIRAPLTPSRPAMAPEGTRMRQRLAAARSTQSWRPRSPPQERTTRSRPALSVLGAISSRCFCVDASTTMLEASTRSSSERNGAGEPRRLRKRSAFSRSRAVAPTSRRPGRPWSRARQTCRPMAPSPAMPTSMLRAWYHAARHSNDGSA